MHTPSLTVFLCYCLSCTLFAAFHSKLFLSPRMCASYLSFVCAAVETAWLKSAPFISLWDPLSPKYFVIFCLKPHYVMERHAAVPELQDLRKSNKMIQLSFAHFLNFFHHCFAFNSYFCSLTSSFLVCFNQTADFMNCLYKVRKELRMYLLYVE